MQSTKRCSTTAACKRTQSADGTQAAFFKAGPGADAAPGRIAQNTSQLTGRPRSPKRRLAARFPAAAVLKDSWSVDRAVGRGIQSRPLHRAWRASALHAHSVALQQAPDGSARLVSCGRMPLTRSAGTGRRCRSPGSFSGRPTGSDAPNVNRAFPADPRASRRGPHLHSRADALVRHGIGVADSPVTCAHSTPVLPVASFPGVFGSKAGVAHRRQARERGSPL